jgi:cytochrome c5
VKNITMKLVFCSLSFCSLMISTFATAQGAPAAANAAIEANIKPVGQVTTTENANTPAVAAAAPAAPKAPVSEGEKIYSTYCTTCHATGVAGAPKITDKAAWEERAKQGMPTLVSHALNGYKGVMPPKGTCMECNEAQLKSAIEYMLGQSKK